MTKKVKAIHKSHLAAQLSREERNHFNKSIVRPPYKRSKAKAESQEELD